MTDPTPTPLLPITPEVAPPDQRRWLGAVILGTIVSIVTGAALLIIGLPEGVGLLAGLSVGTFAGGRYLPARTNLEWVALGGGILLSQMIVGAFLVASYA